MISASKGIPVFDSWDNLIVAIIAVAAIIIGATATIRATRSRIKAEARAGYIDDKKAFFYVRVTNKGSGSVSIKGIRMIVPPRFYNGYLYPLPLPEEVMKGPKLPYTLKGEDSQDWFIEPHMALDFYQAMHGAPSNIPPILIKLMKLNARLLRFMRIRAQIDLGNGKRVRSKWTIGWSWASRVAEELRLFKYAEEKRRKEAASQPKRGRSRQVGSWKFYKRQAPSKRK